MVLSREQFALNPLQWVTAAEGSAGDGSPDGSGFFGDPTSSARYRRILEEVRASGFGAVMMKVPAGQSAHQYLEMIHAVGLRPAPGYVQVTLPEDLGASLRPGSASWSGWFDVVRRRAEESRACGLDAVFLASDIQPGGRVRVDRACAVGAGFDQSRLERVTELIGEAAEVLYGEGVRAALHNHVGTWIETEAEIEHVLASIDPTRLGAGFDIGHLFWAGIDPARMVRRHADRLVALHIKDMDASAAVRSRAVPTPYAQAAATGIFREPGLGDIDLGAVLGGLPDGFGGWLVVEVDRASMPPLASACESWRWVRQVCDDWYDIHTIETGSGS